MERRLAAILAADVVGYSRLMGKDEAGTLATIKTHRKELIEPKVRQYNGRIVKLMGDGVLMEFASAVDAVAFAVEVQCAMRERNQDVPDKQQVIYRIGINIGDIIIEGDDIFGDGVNIAARLEGLATPGGICIARNVINQIKGKLDLTSKLLGKRKIKNIAEPVSVFQVELDDKAEKLITTVQTVVPSERIQALVAASLAVFLVIAGLAWWQPWGPDSEPGRTETIAVTFPNKPSIVVLPFEILSDQSEGKLLSDGIAETITATLGQVPGLFVISRNSAFTYKGKPVKVETVSQELGVRYVLEGSVQRAGDRVRITAQLIDATTDQHLWANRYDRKLDDIFELQDEIALKVLVALQVKLTEGEQANVRSQPTGNVEAYLHYVQAMAAFRTFGKNGMVKTRTSTEKSLAADPAYASALILTAWSHIIDARFLYTSSREESLRKADDFLRDAENLERPLPNRVRGELLMARAFMAIIEGRHAEAVALGSQAVELAPNNAFIVAVQALIVFFVQRYDDSITLFQHAMRLSPAYPSWYPLWLATAYVFKEDHQRALAVLDNSIVRAEGNVMKAAHHVRAAFAQADQGDIDKAKRETARVRMLVPFLSIKFYRAIMHFEHEADWQRFASAMRKAGLPE